MRPLDLYSEKAVKDGNHDKLACSSALLTESHSLTIQQKALQKTESKDKVPNASKAGSDFNSSIGMGQRDKIALASLAFCSPLMMLGMGAALGIVDDIRMSRERALKQPPLPRVGYRPAEIKEEPAVKKTMLSMTPEVPSLRSEAKKSKLEFGNRQENVLYPSETLWRQPSTERSWVKASKILKRKQHLADQLEKCRGMLELSVVSAIVSKIERLDKELKKMGC